MVVLLLYFCTSSSLTEKTFTLTINSSYRLGTPDWKLQAGLGTVAKLLYFINGFQLTSVDFTCILEFWTIGKAHPLHLCNIGEPSHIANKIKVRQEPPSGQELPWLNVVSVWKTD